MDFIQINDQIAVPVSEIEITASRSSGPGGQFVNKTDSRITLRWNVHTTTALSDELKNRVIQNIAHKLSGCGELIIHCSTSRSQQQNKDQAFQIFAQTIQKALYAPKKRMKTSVPRAAKRERLEGKSHRSTIKQLRRSGNYSQGDE